MATPTTEPGDAPLAAARNSRATQDPDIGSDQLPELIGRAVTVARVQQECFEQWRELSHLSRFMTGVRSVTVIDRNHAHLVIGEADDAHQWDIEIIEEQAPSLLVWRTREGKRVIHEGKVEFAPARGGRGTVVTATIATHSSHGIIGQLLGRLFHTDARMHTQRELRRFKQWMETGELSTATAPAAAPRAS